MRVIAFQNGTFPGVSVAGRGIIPSSTDWWIEQRLIGIYWEDSHFSAVVGLNARDAYGDIIEDAAEACSGQLGACLVSYQRLFNQTYQLKSAIYCSTRFEGFVVIPDENLSDIVDVTPAETCTASGMETLKRPAQGASQPRKRTRQTALPQEADRSFTVPDIDAEGIFLLELSCLQQNAYLRLFF